MNHFIFSILIILSLFANANGQEQLFIQNIQSEKYEEALLQLDTLKTIRSEGHYYAAILFAKRNELEKTLFHFKIAANKGLTEKATPFDPILDTLKVFDEYALLKEKIKKNTLVANQELQMIQSKIQYDFDDESQIGAVNLKMTPVKHQGNRNTCSVFAATAIAEFIAETKAGHPWDFSEAYNYYLSKNNALSNVFLKEAYSNLDGLAGYLALNGYSYGVYEESAWPYENTNWLTNQDPRCETVDGKPSTNCFTGIPPEGTKPLALKFKTVFIPLNRIGAFILNQKKPLLVNLWLYRNGINMKTGELSIPPKGEEVLLGGHVVTITGYNSKTEEYIFKNSWGANWGNQGYGKMPKDYLEQHFEASKLLPFNLDATEDEKMFLAKVAMGASLVLD